VRYGDLDEIKALTARVGALEFTLRVIAVSDEPAEALMADLASLALAGKVPTEPSTIALWSQRVQAARRGEPWPYVGLPPEIVWYNGQTNSRCDMLTGPCACGAWHNWEEFMDRARRALERQGSLKKEAKSR